MLFVRRAFNLLVLFLCLDCALLSSAQTTDTSTVGLEAIVARLGGVPPQDSIATARVEITTGTNQQSGSLRVLTRGMTESVEEWTTAGTLNRVVSARGAKTGGAAVRGHQNFYAEPCASQSSYFPLPWLAAKASAKGLQVEDLGIEQTEGQGLRHLKLFRSWQPAKSGSPKEITDSEVWLDSRTGLPARIEFKDENTSSARASVQIRIEYSDYRTVDGVLYPFHIKQYLNGSLRANVHVQDVRFNTGLTDSDFSSK